MAIGDMAGRKSHYELYREALLDLGIARDEVGRLTQELNASKRRERDLRTRLDMAERELTHRRKHSSVITFVKE